MPKFSVVVPLYNEQEVLNELYSRLNSVMSGLNECYEIIFVNDGSFDETENIINDLAKKDKNIKVIHFARNFGHQAAISAGLKEASGKAAIIIDADLQDPPEIIPKMISKWKEGFLIVYGKRIKRHGETILKKMTAKLYYRFLKTITKVDIPVDAGDFRLLDREVIEVFNKMDEKNRYLRGLFGWMGFNKAYVEYERDKRFAGKTKYPINKMIHFAIDGIISFSYIPLKIASFSGFFVSMASFLYLIFIIFKKLFFPSTVIWGWTSLIAVLLFLNGFILIILGLIGEYIGRIYDEVRNRPLYIIKSKINCD